jgi:hypothetical protein
LGESQEGAKSLPGRRPHAALWHPGRLSMIFFIIHAVRIEPGYYHRRHFFAEFIVKTTTAKQA